MIPSALEWIGDSDGYLEIIDQRKLPIEFVKIKVTTVDQLCEAIKSLAVRGAPAIGVAAAYGMVLALRRLDNNLSTDELLKHIELAHQKIASSRPTAVNLFWALERIEKAAKDAITSGTETSTSIKQVVFDTARQIHQEDVDMCLQIGRNGWGLLPSNGAVLTHCNAGALATAGQGTALSVIFEAHKKGKQLKVYVDETRPLLQGARLTMWELQQAKIEAILICDNMAGFLMKQGKIDVVIVGADRIAANGDTANKIGTYSLAVLAEKHKIPFYIAAPSSTFDLSIKSGDDIPIEHRPAEEVRSFRDIMAAPVDSAVYNPAFDVTEASLITAIITEKGVIESPDTTKIVRCLSS